ncbi:hypothetical protein [Pseudovibrio sp. Alg231-02]|uniref:hypothetical protein n=1 Tax=Pseudovibrio sp. Alg231-02 TaxID=1922223 RepID=UPI000D55F7AB|nr:hypothetical protein [Pseudovibrio sp. Alg231-02]
MPVISVRKSVALGFVALFSFSSPSAFAKWKNPADRYAEAYKEYLGAACPIAPDSIKHFVYFARDREAIEEHPFLESSRFVGAQIMYPWRALETSEGTYDFSLIEADLAYLGSKGKRLFVQLQDASFNPDYVPVPDYILSDEYSGGAVYQFDDNNEPEGWVAKRWNSKVQERFAKLLQALGQAFDGRIEGINLQESAIGVSAEDDEQFSPARYSEALKGNMSAMKAAFPTSVTMQYANFMPGEWLPFEDEGYLNSIYEYGESIGVGLGAPDLMVKRRGQLNHTIAMMHERAYSAPLGIAIQDGNYTGRTGTTEVIENDQNIVPLLHAFAQDFMKVDYMFWVNQEPYFESDVLSCFE